MHGYLKSVHGVQNSMFFLKSRTVRIVRNRNNVKTLTDRNAYRQTGTKY